MNNFDNERNILTETVQEKKEFIITSLESGARNYTEIENAYSLYKECLQASDSLLKKE
jgi:hypothetical protein